MDSKLDYMFTSDPSLVETKNDIFSLIKSIQLYNYDTALARKNFCLLIIRSIHRTSLSGLYKCWQ